MIPEIKQQWIAALRSDEFKQGREVLRSDDKFCCLGVLCDLHRKANPIYDWIKADNDEDYIYSPGLEQFELPRVVMDWAGLKYSNPPTPHREFNGKVYQSLAELNDAGATFAEIADIIEADL